MSLTAANAIITLSQPTLFPTPQQLQGFDTDEVTDIESATILQHVMGVDGILSFGFVWAERLQSITLKADSASNAFFDIVNAQQEAVQDVYPLSGTIVLPAIGQKYALINGGLESYKPIPRVQKILRSRTYRIVWGRVVTGPTL